MRQPTRCSPPSDDQDVQPLSGLHYWTINQKKDKHMDDFEQGAVIFLLIIVIGLAAFVGAQAFI